MADDAAMHKRPLRDSGQGLSRREQAGAGEKQGHGLHGNVFGIELSKKCALPLADNFAAQQNEDLWNVDLDRADIVAGSAKRGSIG